MRLKLWITVVAGCVCVAMGALHAAQQPASTAAAWNGVYSEAQASRGAPLYAANCANCHGKDLRGTDRAPAVAGPAFVAAWQGRSVRELFEYVQTRMPHHSPGGLTRTQNSAIVAYMLKQSGVPAGQKDFVGEIAAPAAASNARGLAFYTEEQAVRGRLAFNRNCSACHSTADAKLTQQQINETGFPASFAAPFLQRAYFGKTLYPTVYHLYTKFQSMPPFDTESINGATRADIIAYVLQRNGFPAGNTELKPDAAVMSQMMLNEPGFERIFNGQDFRDVKFVIGSGCAPQPEGCGKTEPGDIVRVDPGGVMYCKCNVHGYWYYGPKKYLNFTARFEQKFVKPEGWVGDEDLYMGGGGWLIFIQDSNLRVFPKSIEVEGRVRDMADYFYLGGGKGKHTYDNAAKTKVVKPFDWNDIEIVSKGGQVKTYINGVHSSTVTEHDYPAGYFGMQIEGSPVMWRNIRIRPE